jgi:hypothetical protein
MAIRLYTVGRNLAGYMPESDTFTTSDPALAVQVLESTMRGYADTDDDFAAWAVAGEGEDDGPMMLATVESILRDDPPQEGEEYGAIVEDNAGRDISFWIYVEEVESLDELDPETRERIEEELEDSPTR